MSGYARQRLITTSAALVSCLILFACGAGLSRVVTLATAIPLLLLPLLYIAWSQPFEAAASACVAATLTLDCFYIEPRYTLRVGSAQDVTTLCAFLAIVLSISRISSRLAEKTSSLVAREAAQLALHRLAERCLVLDWRECLQEDLCCAVRDCFSLESVSLWDQAAGRFFSSSVTQESEPVRAAFMAAKDFDLPGIGVSIRLLRSGVRPIGSLQLQGQLPETSIAGAIGTLVSLTLERARALGSEVRAQLERNSEQLRSSVLDGLAHSIKTPLTTISVASSGVIAIGGVSAPQVRLLSLIEEQAHAIAGLTNKLLSTARLDREISAKLVQTDVLALTHHVAAELDPSLASRVRIQSTEATARIATDPELLRMALVQITENALKYSPSESIVTLTIREVGEDIALAIHNVGTYIPPEQFGLIFERFYRSPQIEQRAPGTGLGLSVARRAIDAVGGSISVSSAPDAGTTFTIALPSRKELHARLDPHRGR